jgi:CubicO group peptidase (beta-lactamase class C family)
MKPRLPLLLSLLVVGICRGQDTARMDQVVQSYVDSGKFMGSVLVARGDLILLNKGYGSADLEWDIPNTPSTKFRLGSLTKQFTAVSVLLLEERGKLSVDDPVKKFMPNAPAAWDKITIFNLLTHTSGIPSFTGFKDYADSEPFATTPTKLVARFLDKPLDFEPGTKWSYSNSGYVLLGYLIEKVSGNSYADFVQKNIFDPLGMRDSGYDSNTDVIRHRASGYVPGPKGPTNAGFIHMTIPFSAGSLYSTTEDLLKWEIGLFGGKLLSAASLQKMTTPFKQDYAFGLGVATVDGKRQISHGGGIEGFNTYLCYFPDDHTTVAVLANLNGGAPGEIGGLLGKLAHGEAVKLTAERKAITVPRDVLQGYVGTYELKPDLNYLVTLDGNQLMGQLGKQPSFPLYPETPTNFFLKVVDAQIEVVKDANGSVSSLILHQGGHDQTMTRKSSTVEAPAAHKEINVPTEALQSYVGSYQLGPQVEIFVTLDDGQLKAQLTGQQKFPIFPEAENKFFFKVVEAQLEFVRGAGGVVTAVILHQNGVDQTAQKE